MEKEGETIKIAETTLAFYNTNAQDFFDGTIDADMSDARERFLKYLPQNSLVLDWGCGSGRDSLAFKEAGFQVEATDASAELCRMASEKLGQQVCCESFEQLEAEGRYDGIWACASLLHIKKDYLPEVFAIACKALKTNGILYTSFKYGETEGQRNGRYFTDMTEERFAESISGIHTFEVQEQWITKDVRPGREKEKWLNVILKKSQ